MSASYNTGRADATTATVPAYKKECTGKRPTVQLATQHLSRSPLQLLQLLAAVAAARLAPWPESVPPCCTLPQPPQHLQSAAHPCETAAAAAGHTTAVRAMRLATACAFGSKGIGVAALQQPPCTTSMEPYRIPSQATTAAHAYAIVRSHHTSTPVATEQCSCLLQVAALVRLLMSHALWFKRTACCLCLLVLGGKGCECVLAAGWDSVQYGCGVF
jgi:hypothetical protein